MDTNKRSSWELIISISPAFSCQMVLYTLMYVLGFGSSFALNIVVVNICIGGQLRPPNFPINLIIQLG